MKLSQIEENIFDDLVQDSHELWEWYAFFRYSYPNQPENEIIKRGRELLAEWVKRGWLEAFQSRDYKLNMPDKELLDVVDKLGTQATDPIHGVILIDLTPQALKDIGAAPSFQEGKCYRNPNAVGEIVRVQSGFPTAHDPVRRGPYAKTSKDGKITYTPLAGNDCVPKTSEPTQ